jgi:hypothetical protein
LWRHFGAQKRMAVNFGKAKNERSWMHYYRGLLLFGIPRLQQTASNMLLTPPAVLEDWIYRYGMRRASINTMLLADREVVVVRNRPVYEVTPFVPQRQFLPPYRPYTDGDYDWVKYVEANHPEYGPLLQWFVDDAAKRGLSEAELYRSIREWCIKAPPQVAEFDRRCEHLKTRRTMFVPSTLVPYFQQKVMWRRTDDLNCPWAANVNEQQWILRLNDFPDELLYTLWVGQQAIGEFNDFPKSWGRSSRSRSH